MYGLRVVGQSVVAHVGMPGTLTPGEYLMTLVTLLLAGLLSAFGAPALPGDVVGGGPYVAPQNIVGGDPSIHSAGVGGRPVIHPNDIVGGGPMVVPATR
jgi:hypothetical protein